MNNDADVALALELETTLAIIVGRNVDVLPKSIDDLRESLTTLIENATELVSALDSLNVGEKKDNRIRNSISSPIKNSEIANLPAFEKVKLNDDLKSAGVLVS